MSRKSYSSFVLNLISARRLQEQASAVYGILSGEVKDPISGDDSKAFLINLALDTFGSDYRSDLVLCSWGLLKGYNEIPRVTDRRIKYLMESGYTGRRTSVPKKELPRSLSERSKDLIKTENILYLEIESKWTFYVKDKPGFLAAARTTYHEGLPVPSYQTQAQAQIQPQTQPQIPVNSLPNPLLRRFVRLCLPEDFCGNSYFQEMMLAEVFSSAGNTASAAFYQESAAKTRDDIIHSFLDKAPLSALERSVLESELSDS